MGRRKIEIEFIKEDRGRSTTFIKRKAGLFKKAHELAVLTGAKVAVVIFSQQERCHTYGSIAPKAVCDRYLALKGKAYEVKSPADVSTSTRLTR